MISVAAPILDASGEAVGAISVCAPDNRATVASCETLGENVAAAARAASHLLGYLPEE